MFSQDLHQYLSVLRELAVHEDFMSITSGLKVTGFVSFERSITLVVDGKYPSRSVRNRSVVCVSLLQDDGANIANIELDAMLWSTTQTCKPKRFLSSLELK